MEMKNKRVNRNWKKTLIFLCVLWSSILFVPQNTHAQGVDPFAGFRWLGVLNRTFQIVDYIYPFQDIFKTASIATLGSFLGFGSNAVVGIDIDTLSNCALTARDRSPDGTLVNADLENTREFIEATPELDNEASYTLALEAAQAVPDDSACDLNRVPLSPADPVTRTSGSLLGMAVGMEKTLHRDKVPVNMAYFFKDYAQRVPLVKNTAFAQTEDNYLGSHLVYALWMGVRNVALGLMSLFLLVVGIMIMTRKKINPQTVVTVQNSLPRIAISIVLIFFSYAIGAFILSLLLPLMYSAPAMAIEFMLNSGVLADIDWVRGLFTNISGNVVMVLIGWGILATVGVLTWSAVGGIGTAFAFLLLILIAALVIIALIAFVKILITYVKLLTYIVISPIYFAVGVIPGKENMVLDWFKEMLSGVLSVVAMMFMISIAFVIPVFSIASTRQGHFINNTLTGLFIPTVMLFTLISSVRMPGKIDKWIKGDKRR